MHYGSSARVCDRGGGGLPKRLCMGWRVGMQLCVWESVSVPVLGAGGGGGFTLIHPIEGQVDKIATTQGHGTSKRVDAASGPQGNDGGESHGPSGRPKRVLQKSRRRVPATAPPPPSPPQPPPAPSRSYKRVTKAGHGGLKETPTQRHRRGWGRGGGTIECTRVT